MTRPTLPGYNRLMIQSPPPQSVAPPRLLTIAIDGPAGAGKSTVARHLAQRLSYTYIDTGAMYRAVAWAALDRGTPTDDPEAVSALAERLDIHLEPGDSDERGTRVFVDGREITDEIRTPEISSLTSPLSAIPAVRHRLVALQQRLGALGGVVMEGRDIGTVVLPDADIKVFLTATSHRRAERRRAELSERGLEMSFEELLEQIEERDQRDASRDVSPMVAASDAHVLDSDPYTADEVVERILSWHSKASERR
ncbi:MAG: (d)CMP kinase [Capsulimonas sp.]|uniref:(d)CMP kinase n=1 Tax=Capsulimonas sp. TaxID=2494211 RepID=UPI003265EBF6